MGTADYGGEEEEEEEEEGASEEEADLEDPPDETLRIVLVDGQPVDIQQLEEDVGVSEAEDQQQDQDQDQDDYEDFFEAPDSEVSLSYRNFAVRSGSEEEEEEDVVGNGVFEFDDAMSESSDLKVYRILVRELAKERTEKALRATSERVSLTSTNRNNNGSSNGRLSVSFGGASEEVIAEVHGSDQVVLQKRKSWRSQSAGSSEASFSAGSKRATAPGPSPRHYPRSEVRFGGSTSEEAASPPSCFPALKSSKSDELLREHCIKKRPAENGVGKSHVRAGKSPAIINRVLDGP